MRRELVVVQRNNLKSVLHNGPDIKPPNKIEGSRSVDNHTTSMLVHTGVYIHNGKLVIVVWH